MNRYADFYKTLGTRGQLLFNVSDKLAIDVRANVVSREGGSGIWQSNTPDGSDIVWDGVTYKEGLIQTSLIGNATLDFEDVTVKLTYDFDSTTLTSISNYTHVKQTFQTDLDYLPVNIISADVDPEENDILMQEFRLSSNSDQALRWMVGAFWQDNERSKNIPVYIGKNQDEPGVVADVVVPAETLSKAYAAFYSNQL